jgi:hypothetical protein
MQIMITNRKPAAALTLQLLSARQVPLVGLCCGRLVEGTCNAISARLRQSHRRRIPRRSEIRLRYARLTFYVTCAFALQMGITLAGDTDSTKANPLGALQIGQLEATLQHPLFSPNRRRLLPAIVPVIVQLPDVTLPAPPDLTLLGTLSDREGRRAIIKPNTRDKTRVVQIGDDVAGWKVAMIEPQLLVLAQDERSSTFALFKGEKSDTKPSAR